MCAPSDNWDDLGQTSPAGLGITTTDNEGFGSGTDFTINSRFTSEFGGTSSATPTVAGVCGLVLSANRALTAAQVRKIVQDTADKDLVIFSDTPVNKPGNFASNGKSLWFGHGKVNAFRAVQAAGGSSTQGALDQSVAANLRIPDVGAPVVSQLQVAADGTVSDVRVTIDISHTYISDLQISLIAPDGSSVALHNHTGGSANDIKKTYSALEIPALRTLDGKAAHGVWKLRVVDTFRLDEGRINSWRLAGRLTTNSA